ncbi:MAG: glucose-1-phosphate adenylyltransferase [Acidobacteriota bacterium]
MKNVLAILMAGGAGERLYPLTKHEAKPAVPFGGVYRIIDFTLSNCINSGIKKIFILTQYKSLSLNRHIRDGWNVFSASLGEFVEILPPQKRVSDTWYLGTADSVYQNIYSIQIENPTWIFVLAGDHVYKMDYSLMLNYHIKKKADFTVGIFDVEIQEASRFGVLEVDEELRIIGFEEKPSNPKPTPFDSSRVYVSMGIYVFNSEILIKELEVDSSREDSSHDFGRDVIPKMIKEYRVHGYSFKDEDINEPKYWKDIGTLDAYYEANMDLVSVVPVFNLYDPNWPLRTYQPQYPPAKFVFADEGKRMGVALDSIVSMGCIISGGKVVNSVLSPNVRINSYSLVEQSVLMNDVNVGRYAKIRKAIIDRETPIPPGTIIGYDLEEDSKRFTVTEKGVVVVQKEDFNFKGGVE